MIRNKIEGTQMIIDLLGPEGNAFFLLGIAKKLAKLQGLDPKPILDDMQSGNYEHLVQVFDDHFGEYVILER